MKSDVKKLTAHLMTGKFWKELLLMTFAMFVVVVGIYYFLLPSKVIVGTLAGITIVLNEILSGTGINLGVSFWLFALNTLLILIGLLLIGREFGAKTIYTSLIQGPMMTFLEKYFPYQNYLEPGQTSIMNDPWLDLLSFVIMIAAAQAMLFKINASSGGLDIIAKIMNKYLHTDLGTSVTIAGIVCSATAFAINPFRLVVVGLIGTWLNGIMVDYFMASISRRKRVCIISEDNERIREFIVKKLVRGCTIYETIGGYSGEKHTEIQALLTKDEFAYIMEFMKDNDIKAFVTAGNVSEVYGYWIKHHFGDYRKLKKK